MTLEEYSQLKAFARVDGVYVGAAWIVSFAFYVKGLTTPWLGMLGTAIAVISPFAVAMLLKKFRDDARNGVISFRRGMAFYALVFLYASLLLAVAQYAYFAFMDKGYLIECYTAMMHSPEAETMMSAYGVSQQQIDDSLALLRSQKPISIVLNIFSMNIILGLLFSLPAAAVMKRTQPGRTIRRQ